MQYTLKNAVVVAVATLTGSTAAIAGITLEASVGTYSTQNRSGTTRASVSSSSANSLPSTSFSLDLFRPPFNVFLSSHSASAEWTSPVSVDLSTTIRRGTPDGDAVTNYTWASTESTISDLVITRANGDTSPGTARLSIVYDYTNSGSNGIDFLVKLGTNSFTPNNADVARSNSGPFTFAYNTTGNATDQVGMFIDVPLNTPLFLYQRYGNAVGFGPVGTYTSAASFNIDGVVFDPSNPEGSDGYVFSSETLGITDSSFAIPAPGAVAVLGLGGFIAARRRR